MPSPRKRAVRAACGNILGAEPTATQIAYSNAWWTTVLTEHGNNYKSARNGGKPFENGESVLIGGGNPDYDGLIAGGEGGPTASIAANARISCASGNTDSADQFAEKEYFKITDAAGTVKHYVLTNATGGGVATGTVMTAGSDVGSTTLGSAIADLGVCIAVQVTINGGSESNQAQLLNELRTAINHTNGHNAGSANSVITMPAALTPAGTVQFMSFANKVGGASGNVTITKTGLTEFTIAGFAGGADPLTTAVPHFWFDTTNTDATAATKALTTAEGVLYDPSGPHSKYIPVLEDVSAGTKKFVCIKPTGWSANDYISWELIGDTEGTNDKLSLHAIDSGNNLEFLTGIKSDGTFENVDAKHGTVLYEGRETYATGINEKGILVAFDADGTGADDSSMKDGWYFRWSYTAV